MKSYIKKRKHRNGVRPQRKGVLKVNFIELPIPNPLSHTQQTLTLLIELNQSLHKPEQEFKLLDQVERMQKAFDFLIGQQQVNPFDIAVDAVNGVQNLPAVFESMDDVCNRCEEREFCRLHSMLGLVREAYCLVQPEKVSHLNQQQLAETAVMFQS